MSITLPIEDTQTIVNKWLDVRFPMFNPPPGTIDIATTAIARATPFDIDVLGIESLAVLAVVVESASDYLAKMLREALAATDKTHELVAISIICAVTDDRERLELRAQAVARIKNP